MELKLCYNTYCNEVSKQIAEVTAREILSELAHELAMVNFYHLKFKLCKNYEDKTFLRKVLLFIRNERIINHVKRERKKSSSHEQEGATHGTRDYSHRSTEGRR